MAPTPVSLAAELLARAEPAVAAAFLGGLRLLPAALLSPFLGGPAVPAAARLALAFGLGAAAASAAGWTAPGGAALLAAAVRELALGVALGLCAALPTEVARTAGQLADQLRGASLGELHAAPVRQRESAAGNLLVQWTLPLAAAAGADRLLLGALVGTFATQPPGPGAPGPVLLQGGLAAAGELLSAGLLLGAPAAAGVLCAEVALALAARASPAGGAAAALQPGRALLGLLPLALGASALGGRLVEEVAVGARLAATVARGGP